MKIELLNNGNVEYKVSASATIEIESYDTIGETYIIFNNINIRIASNNL